MLAITDINYLKKTCDCLKTVPTENYCSVNTEAIMKTGMKP